jgi:hypothetical protein
MTCPCGHYDYVDSTVETLPDVMACMYDSYRHEHFLCLSFLFFKKQIIESMAIELYMKR